MEKNITALFEINVPKTAKQLAKFVSKDTLRPQFCYVCIEPGRGFMTATDTRKLQVVNVDVVSEWPERMQVLINPKHVAKIAGKTATVTVSEVGRAISVEIEADGEIYTTEYTAMDFPDVKRVIPLKDGCNAIRLTAENIEALKTICKLHKAANYITLATAEGDTRLIVCNEIKDYSENRTSYNIELATPAEGDIIMNLDPTLLSDCLVGCNGVILVDDRDKPILFEGKAETTLLMPMRANEKNAEFVSKMRDSSILVGSTFAEDATEVVKQLKETAAELWQEITDNQEDLIPGNYSTNEITKQGNAQYGYIVMPCRGERMINITSGNISMQIDYSELFSILATWEAATNSPKMTFKVGDVEEVTENVYMPNGSEVKKKTLKLRKLGDDWYTDARRSPKDYDAPVYCRVNGKIIYTDRISFKRIDNAEEFAQWSAGKKEQIPDLIREVAEESVYYARLSQILGIDAVSEEEAKRNIERKETEWEKRRMAEEQNRLARLRELEEAEERRKAELLADGKEKLMTNKAVTVEQIELLAEAVGYKIHIRTIGFMREKVSEAVLNAGETVTVLGRKLTHRNISGTADVLREIAARIKAQAEEVQQPATPSETPQISTETAEAGNVSAEEEKREETPNIDEINSFISRNGFVLEEQFTKEVYKVTKDDKELTSWLTLSELWQWICDYKEAPPEPIEKLEHLPQPPKYRVWRFAKQGYAQIIVGDYSQWKVVAILSFVFGKTKIEVCDDVAHIHTIGAKELHINKPIAELTDAEVLELIYGNTKPTQPPKFALQSPETLPAVNYATPTPKTRETVRKRQNCGLGANGYRLLSDAIATLAAVYALTPGICSPANSPPTGSP